MATICFLTAGQPSTTPRLVKAADVLFEAGHVVHVVSGHWSIWADRADAELLRTRRWSWRMVGGHPRREPLRYQWTRARFRVGRSVSRRWPNPWAMGQALCRIAPELGRAAQALDADLYIAHGVGALAPAFAAARRRRAAVAFDAEDFHSGCAGAAARGRRRLTARAEAMYLPHCCFITAGSPGIAAAYARTYGIAPPTPILNVFPLAQRPPAWRPSLRHEPLRLYWFSQTIGAGRGLEDAVRALGQLSAARVELHLRGAWQRGYREQLEQLAAACGVAAERLVYHPPAAPDQMVSLAGQYDVGLALEPGRDQNNQLALSNKLFTYLLAGNAVAASATPAQRSLIASIDGAGVAYPPGDVDALAACLRQWSEDHQALNRVRQRAWVWGSARYNWEMERVALVMLVERALLALRTQRRAGSAAWAPVRTGLEAAAATIEPLG